MAKVLSTTSRAPASWAIPASAAMSATASSGLVGVSHQISRVVSRTAARTASRSCCATAVNVTPQRSSTFANSRNVPP